MAVDPHTAPRRADLLATELAHARISPAAFAVGRGLEDALEAARRSGGAGWRERVDASPDAEGGAVAGLDAVRRARVALERVERVIGTRGATRLRDVLADGLSFEELAIRHGRNTRRGIASIASQVRADLEKLARTFAARGKVVAEASDKYAEAAQSINHGMRKTKVG